MDWTNENRPPRTEAQKAKLWATLAMWLYIAWIVVESQFWYGMPAHAPLTWGLHLACAIGARAAAALALRSLIFLVVDRLDGPTRS